jgi:sulfate adenylyltransferase subunit 2
VFPISNWTELDVWQYIDRENIELPSLYYAHQRQVVERKGLLVPVTDLTPLKEGEVAVEKTVRFRTLGCYPLTGAMESSATTLEEIILELVRARTSERIGRAIDSDSSGSMERKKQEGYF